MIDDNIQPNRPLALSYERRLNAVRHGILSRHLVLPWEDQREYDDLLKSLVAEHAPSGTTEHHLVEELAGIIWRKQRVVMAEAAACRAGLHCALEKKAWRDDDVRIRALAHLERGNTVDTAASAVHATPEDTEAEVRELAAEEAMTERALSILRKSKSDAYSKALAALHEDTLAGWSDTLAQVDAEDLDGGEYEGDDEAAGPDPYQPDAPSLERFLNDEIVPWYQQRRRELQNRNLIRSQAFGELLGPDRLDKLARYEVHLDRKFERILGMLLKLQDLRRTIAPDPAA